MPSPRILVYSSLFPSPEDPNAGVFVRERMFRVAQHLPIVVVSPKAWSPFDWLIRLRRPRFRPVAPRVETQQGIIVYAPRFFSLPGVLKHWDSTFMALGSYLTVRHLRKKFEFNVIDAHFGYPDGHAASLLAKWFRVPFTITLRGNEQVYSLQEKIKTRLRAGLRKVDKAIGVADILTVLAQKLGTPPHRAITIGNGVDCDKFRPESKAIARAKLDIPESVPVLISIGQLVEGKGMHRVIELMPELMKTHPNLHYLIVGASPPTTNMEQALREQVERLGLTSYVHFLGQHKPENLKWLLSAADVFVLATRREGWANVLLEAMACGLPIVTTDVGGNKQVVCRPELGEIVTFGDPVALRDAIIRALRRSWDHAAIRMYAEENAWARRIQQLLEVFTEVNADRPIASPSPKRDH